jgi:DHA1 family putative efflux transporter-like MFS transporter
MLWAFSAWSSGPTQQYYLMTLSPEASGIMLSVNTSVLQLAMAAGAGVGGIVVDGVSLSAVGWLGAAGVAIAAVLAASSFGYSRNKSRILEERLRLAEADSEATSA